MTTERLLGGKCGLTVTSASIPSSLPDWALPPLCVSSLVRLGKHSLAHARSSWCHTCETRHSDPPLPRTEHSLSSPQTEWCQRCRQRLGNCDVLGENSQPCFKIRHSGEGISRFVRAAPPRLERQTQLLCMFGQGIIGQELGQHVQQGFSKVPTFPISSSLFSTAS